MHRAGKPGHFIINRAPPGRRAGGHLPDQHGLSTYKALHTPPEDIPFLRVVLRTDSFAHRGISVDLHRGKSVTNAFNSLPSSHNC